MRIINILIFKIEILLLNLINQRFNVNNNNNFYGENNSLNKSYPNKIVKAYNFKQVNKQNKNINQVPLSYVSSNTNMKNITNKKQNVMLRLKNFNFLNISPFKKRNNNIQNNKNNNGIKIDNNKKLNQLNEELKIFNKKYNINLGKNDKSLIKNKLKKFKMSKMMITNKSADNNKFNQMKNKFNKYKYDANNNNDKNCIII